jgi:hypothetical protein
MMLRDQHVLLLFVMHSVWLPMGWLALYGKAGKTQQHQAGWLPSNPNRACAVVHI